MSRAEVIGVCGVVAIALGLTLCFAGHFTSEKKGWVRTWVTPTLGMGAWLLGNSGAVMLGIQIARSDRLSSLTTRLTGSGLLTTLLICGEVIVAVLGPLWAFAVGTQIVQNVARIVQGKDTYSIVWYRGQRTKRRRRRTPNPTSLPPPAGGGGDSHH